MTPSADFLDLLALSKEMRKAAETEQWALLEQLHNKHRQMLAKLPSPSSAERVHLAQAFEELTTAIDCATACRDQIGILLKPFDKKSAATP